MPIDVLYVDDEKPNLAVFKGMCGDDFSVLTAASGQAALELMRQQPVSVLLTDQMMPGMTGVELLEKVEKEFPNTVRLLVTAYSDLQAAEDAINRGHARRYLRKPWDPESLKAELRDALSIHDLNQEVYHLHQQLLTNERWAGAAALAIADEVKSCLGLVHDTLSETQMFAETITDSLDKPAPSIVQVRASVAQLESTIGGLQDDMKRAISLLDIPTIPPENRQAAQTTSVDEVVKVVLASVDDTTRARTELAIESVPPVTAEAEDLQFIMLCILTTAVQRASVVPGDKGKVRISTDHDDGYVYIDTNDNGPALSDKQMRSLLTNPRSALTRARGVAIDLGGELSVHQTSQGNTLVRFAIGLTKEGH